MGFWIFMLIMILIIPVTMTGFGRLFLRKVPDKINYVFGYRTKRSMRNKDTWDFAHKYIGKLWFTGGLIILLLSIVTILFLTGKDTDTVGTAGAVITGIQMIPLLGSIIMTEEALKKNFDDTGRRRS